MRLGTFKKEERLCSKKEISLLFEQGKTLSVPSLRLIWVETQSPDMPLKAGFSVSKRNFKKASERNRIRRLMRETYRLNKNVLTRQLAERKKGLSCMFIYSSQELPSFHKIQDKIVLLLHRLSQIHA
ncbi:MAG: ribonuclease P protein component [Bacteroidia bacterium]|nr:ribonuclease P protein component [Bacteroidia bacterium]MCZ2278416.1 ribonuclease P protein component [Bacteroidia bacterium]